MSANDTWPDSAERETYAYLTTLGRTSGDPHRIEIWFALEDDRVFLLSGGRDRSDWVKNLIANPAVILEIGEVTREGSASVLEAGTPDDRPARELLVEKYQKKDELAEWGRNSLGVVIEFGTDEAAK